MASLVHCASYWCTNSELAIGFYDQLALFSWVKRHIAGFSGDVDNITAFGESAGAFSIASLVARQNPAAEGPLFNRAILQSGSPSTMKFKDCTTPYVAYDKLLAAYGLSDPALTATERIAGLRDIPAQELCDFGVKHGGGWGGTITSGNKNALFAVEPEQSYLRGEYDRNVKEFVLGTNADEGVLFSTAFNVRVHYGSLI